jgi:hypothetical protein
MEIVEGSTSPSQDEEDDDDGVVGYVVTPVEDEVDKGEDALLGSAGRGGGGPSPTDRGCPPVREST